MLNDLSKAGFGFIVLTTGLGLVDRHSIIIKVETLTSVLQQERSLADIGEEELLLHLAMHMD